MEGGADFVAQLISGGTIHAGLYEWALSREPELWAEFKAEMDGTDASRWMYRTGTSERPGDLGYFIGYRISNAFYDASTDKRAAIRELIAMRDAHDILRRSGYSAERYRPRTVPRQITTLALAVARR